MIEMNVYKEEFLRDLLESENLNEASWSLTEKDIIINYNYTVKAYKKIVDKCKKTKNEKDIQKYIKKFDKYLRDSKHHLKNKEYYEITLTMKSTVLNIIKFVGAAGIVGGVLGYTAGPIGVALAGPAGAAIGTIPKKVINKYEGTSKTVCIKYISLLEKTIKELKSIKV